MTRLFVALAVPDVVRAGLDAALVPVRRGRPHLRWSTADTWHLTLAFLGDVEDDVVAATGAAVDAAARAAAPVDVVLGRAGRFGQGVLWLGLTDPAYAAVRALGERVRAELDAAGVAHDRKPLHPHLTLARARRDGPGASRSRVAEVDAAVADLDPRAWTATVVTVYASALHPDGARHVAQHVAALGQPPATE